MTEYSKEQLNQLNKDELIQLVLSRQTEMLQMDRNIQLILEQLAVPLLQFWNGWSIAGIP